MFIVTLEHLKCDELTRGLCRSRPNLDVFDHFSMMKVAETFCGCGHPPSSATCQRPCPPTCPWTCYRPKTPRCAQEHDRGQTTSNRCSPAAAVRGDIQMDRGRSFCCCCCLRICRLPSAVSGESLNLSRTCLTWCFHDLGGPQGGTWGAKPSNCGWPGGWKARENFSHLP